MTVYWIISYIILIFCAFELFSIKQLNDTKVRHFLNWCFFVAAIILVFFGGMRGASSGIDDGQYVAFYHDFAAQLHISDYDSITDIYRYEKLFMLLAWVLSFFTSQSYYFLFFVCVVAVSTNAYCYKKYSPLILCSLCLYSAHLFINKDMNQIRFGLCSAFAVASLCTAANRKYLWSLVFFIFSTQSHSTGWTLLLILPFLFIREMKYLGIIMILVAIPLGIIGGKKLFLDSFGLVPVLGDRAMDYSGTAFDTNTPVFSLGNFKNIGFVVFFTLYYFKEGIKEDERLVYILLIAYSIGAAVRITFSDFGIFGGRVGNLFLHTEPLLLAFLLKRLRNPLLTFGILAAMTTYYLAYNTILSVQSILGYSVAPLFKIF
ncbi:amylovoran biosynthesis protein AmsC [Erwinia typographi]|uniref:Amylovoran biosynthesis protein AmsC n=1 Tax=Erwinia typographi TaxID=371042 RepID=A0A0A3ZAA7_9GAMM|nr:EpsG family protein [Erwinia typographi]KGT95830.1 amylovoran biosynthesis protein AmsC [Erwinia typographi]